MNENYGVKGHVHTLQQRKVRKLVGLEHLPNHDSFDVEFTPSGQVVRTANYNMAGEVIGSELFVYDGSERLLCSVELDGSGQEIRSSEFKYENPAKRVVRTCDPSGNITSHSVEIYEKDLLQSLAVYDEKDQLKIEKSFKYADGKPTKSDSKYYLPDGSLNEELISTFDSHGRIARTFGLKPNGQPLGDGKYIYEYDDEGRLSKRWSFNDHADENVANAITIHEYSTDDVGNWLERRDFHQFRGDSRWSKSITTRKLTYFPVGWAKS